VRQRRSAAADARGDAAAGPANAGAAANAAANACDAAASVSDANARDAAHDGAVAARSRRDTGTTGVRHSGRDWHDAGRPDPGSCGTAAAGAAAGADESADDPNDAAQRRADAQRRTAAVILKDEG
jgi:hypothetical protein